MRGRTGRYAVVAAVACVTALVAVEAAWAPWHTAQTTDGVNDLATCPEGIRLGVVTDPEGDGDGPPPAPLPRASNVTLHVVFAVNWTEEGRFPRPRDKILLESALPLLNDARAVHVNGADFRWWNYYGLVTVLWDRPLKDGENPDVVVISFDRFTADPPPGSGGNRFYGPFTVGTGNCPVAADGRVEGDKCPPEPAGDCPDIIFGNSGPNKLLGEDGNDFIKGGSGEDTLDGGPGNDAIDAADGEQDVIDCGTGKDRVTADSVDVVHPGCERVKIRA